MLLITNNTNQRPRFLSFFFIELFLTTMVIWRVLSWMRISMEMAYISNCFFLLEIILKSSLQLQFHVHYLRGFLFIVFYTSKELVMFFNHLWQFLHQCDWIMKDGFARLTTGCWRSWWSLTGTRISDGVVVVMSNICGRGRTKVLVIYLYGYGTHRSGCCCTNKHSNLKLVFEWKV